ncbi:MAG: RelA/SpoT family protein [Dehalococcoidia bacterium]
MAVELNDGPPNAEELFSRVLDSAGRYLPPERLGMLREAYTFAEACHRGQARKAGGPYITHPLEVTEMATRFELDEEALAAALLHDVQEDCGVTNDDLSARFGANVARMVDGLSKLDKLPINFASDDQTARDSVQAQNLRKLFLAMAEDIDVVLIKLCDRVHNMETLWAFRPEKQRRIARETLEIFAPLASRLGVWQLKWQLEDLAFRYLEPTKYAEITESLTSKRQQREEYIEDARRTVAENLAEHHIAADVKGRAKHIYSIYQKINKYAAQAKGFDQIYDLLALRVFVESISECYQALGVIHGLWRPIPGQFDDYIANPKDSMYQSLHTTVLGPGGRPIEIQIRTWEMHRVAEYGVAAHWRYKEGRRKGAGDEERIAWLRELMDIQRELGGAEEFVETVKTDIFQDQVFVFTPKGDVIDLPAGATPLDYAYRIHTDLGHQTIGAKVNARIVQLTHTLQNGDVVEIMRSRASKGPSRDWLNGNLGYVKTAHSREKIRAWFRRQQRADNIERGRDMFEKEMKRLAIEIGDREAEVLELFGMTSWDDFFAALGYGGISIITIARKLGALFQEEEPLVAEPVAPAQKGPATPTFGSKTMQVLGVNNLLTTMARCCSPVPGDQISGYVTRARGITVHRADCINILNSDEPERILEVEWGEAAKLYPVDIRITAWDRVGLLRDVTSVVTEDKVNMVGVHTLEGDDGSVVVLMTLETTGVEQLSRLLSRIEILRGVREVERVVDGKRAHAKRPLTPAR